MPALKAVKFWCSLLALNTLACAAGFFLQSGQGRFFPVPPPEEVDSWYRMFLYFFLRRESQDLLRVSADLLLALPVLVFLARARGMRWASRVVAAFFLFFAVFDAYDLGISLAFRKQALLAEDLGLLTSGFYFLRDAATPAWILPGILGFLVAIVLVLAVPKLFANVAEGATGILARRGGRLAVGAGMAFLLVHAGVSLAWFGAESRVAVSRFVVPRIVANAQASVRFHLATADLVSAPPDDAYAAFDNVALTAKPDVYLVMLESYGKILFDHPALTAEHGARLASMEADLRAAGWKSASNFSEAPIYGGRSWLSIGTVLGGVSITNQTLHRLLTAQGPEYPHLVRFLRRQGYTTVALQPPVRERPGVPLQNPFGFDRLLGFADLAYTGPAYGWGHIPDQHSLNHAFENVVAKLRGPRFLYFMTATSHTPWNPLPPLVDDWRTLNRRKGEPGDPAPAADGASVPAASLDAYSTRLGFGGEDLALAYSRSIGYELEVLRRFVREKVPSDAIVILLGDHQPPLPPPQRRRRTGVDPGEDFRTPVHVLTRSAHTLQALRAFGFVEGMSKDPEAEGSLRHEGIFSMLVSVLSAQEEYYRPTGSRLSIRTP